MLSSNIENTLHAAMGGCGDEESLMSDVQGGGRHQIAGG